MLPCPHTIAWPSVEHHCGNVSEGISPEALSRSRSCRPWACPAAGPSTRAGGVASLLSGRSAAPRWAGLGEDVHLPSSGDPGCGPTDSPGSGGRPNGASVWSGGGQMQ